MERSQVDERFPLCYYFRAANQIVRQAKVYRKEGNIDDLYLAVTRYLRLMTEIIPQHRGYSGYSSKEKLHHRKIVQEFTKELKRLKPVSGIKENDTSKQPSRWSKHTEDDSCLPSQRCSEDDSCLPLQRCSANNQAYTRSYSERKVNFCKTIGTEGHSSSMESIKFEDGNMRNARTTCLVYQTAFPVALTVARDHNINVNVVRHYFPSPLLSCTESLPLVGHVSHFTIPESRNQYLESRCKESSTSRAIQDVHISARLMEEFMELARANTDKNLETCGILGAFLKNQTFYATTLIVPKQESTCNSCQALNEEEIYAVLDQQSLFPLGWIHTHPSQTCFLSSIDVHTQYSYQVMVPEAVAIVMAPTDPTRSYGIFRLTDPGGITILRECEERGFHPHPETADGSPIYESCSNVYINPNLRFEIIDLRSSSLEI